MKNEVAVLSLPDKKELFLAVFREVRGNIAEACRVLGMGRTTYSVWARDDSEFAAAVAEAREEIIDWAEGKLLDNVGEHISRDIHYYLDAQARHRGYGRSAEPQPLSGGVVPVGVLVGVGYPPTPVTIEDWEAQYRQSREKLVDVTPKSGEQLELFPGWRH